MTGNGRFIKKAEWRPKKPNNRSYEFNCCVKPDVWDTEDGAECRNCGYDWTEEKPT